MIVMWVVVIWLFFHVVARAVIESVILVGRVRCVLYVCVCVCACVCVCVLARVHVCERT